MQKKKQNSQFCLFQTTKNTTFLSLFQTACSEEVKGIEFTVTTLNCPQEQNTPEPRRKFSSLRKTGGLSKVVRSKISKSFYNSNSDHNNKKNDKNVITVATSEDEKNNGSGMNATATTTAAITATGATAAANATNTITTTNTTTTSSTTPTTTHTGNKSEKHKKRSKLCQLL